MVPTMYVVTVIFWKSNQKDWVLQAANDGLVNVSNIQTTIDKVVFCKHVAKKLDSFVQALNMGCCKEASKLGEFWPDGQKP